MVTRIGALALASFLIISMGGCKSKSSSGGSSVGLIDGYVTDATSGAPISQAKVQINGATMDSLPDGRFTLNVAVEGNQTITAVKDGYETYINTAPITLGTGVRFDIQMTRFTPATVSSTNPAHKAQNVATNSAINATFSKTMNAATITSATFFVTAENGALVGGSVTCNGTTAVFTPTDILPYSTSFIARIVSGNSGVRDLTGQSLQLDYTWTFKTGTVPDTTLPTVSSTSLTQPANTMTGVPVNSGVSVNFSEPMDSSTITTATFMIKDIANNPIRGTVTSSNATAIFVPSGDLAANTRYTVIVTTGAKDLAGNPLVHEYAWSFITGDQLDTTRPSISFTSPPDGAVNVAPNDAITATFTENMDALTLTTSNFTLSLTGGAQLSGNVTYNGTTAAFTPTTNLAYQTSYTASISTGARDIAGNALANNTTWTFTTGLAPDTVLPTLTTTTPAALVNVATNAGVTIVFSEPMDASTINTSTVTVTDATGAPVNGSVTVNGTIATFIPSGNLTPNTTYTVTIADTAKDLAGNALSPGGSSLSFTTAQAPDTIPPAIISVTPSDNSAGVVNTLPLTATFSEPMYAASITSATFLLKDPNNQPISGSVVCSDMTATFTPSVELSFVTTYTAMITTGVTDIAGNALAANQIWSFTTGILTTAPKAPKGVSATAGNGQAIVRWDAANGATSYNVYRSTTSGVNKASSTVFQNVSSPFTDSTVTNKTTYYYAVSAVNSYALTTDNESSLSTPEISVTPSPAPNPPTGVSILPGYQVLTISWNSSNEATSYNIYWSTTPGVTKSTGIKIANASSPYVHTGGLNTANTYYYVVTSVNSFGESVESVPVSAKPDGNLSSWTLTISPGSSLNARALSLIADPTAIYITGFAAEQWRTEKRSLTNGTPVPTFGIQGHVTSLQNVGKDNVPYVVVSDSSSIYLAGYDKRSNQEWRIEKYDMATGSLVTSFGTMINGARHGGVVESTSSCKCNDVIYAAAVNPTESALYVVGMDAGLSGLGSDTEWRIEKRDLTTGDLVATFGTNGIVVSNPGAGLDEARAVVPDPSGTAIYILGFESISDADTQWRIEKRNTSDGSLVASFGAGGVVTSNPSVGFDKPFALSIDSTGVYAAGFDSVSGAGNTEWRIEKRNLVDGSLNNLFGNTGVVTSNPSTSDDEINAMYLDLSGLTVVGYDSSAGAGNSGWRVERRLSSSGGLMTGFATNGVYLANPSQGNDAATSVVADSTSIYIAGYDSSLSSNNSEWMVVKLPK